MDEERYKSIMHTSIQNRKESEQWNLDIASRVLEKKRIRRKVFAYSCSLAAAAMVIIGLTFGILNKPQQGLYDPFISNQLAGTHGEVFDEDTAYYSELRSEDVIFMSETDSLINETLANR